MERLSDSAIELINDMHIKRLDLDYYGEYLPLIDAAIRLSDYEDTGLEPNDVTDLMAAHGEAVYQLAEWRALGPIKHLRELVQAEAALEAMARDD